MKYLFLLLTLLFSLSTYAQEEALELGAPNCSVESASFGIVNGCVGALIKKSFSRYDLSKIG